MIRFPANIYKHRLLRTIDPFVFECKEEAFVTAKLESAVKNNSKDDIFVLDGVSYNGIRHHREVVQQISDCTVTYQLNK